MTTEGKAMVSAIPQVFERNRGSIVKAFKLEEFC